MTIETDILKTLQSIEALLEGASVLAKDKRLPTAKRDMSKRERADKEVSKAFKATAEAAKAAPATILALNRALGGLGDEVSLTTRSFSGLNASLGRFATSLQTSDSILDQGSNGIQQTLGTLNASLTAFQRQLMSAPAPVAQVVQPPPIQATAPTPTPAPAPATNRQAASILGSFRGMNQATQNLTRTVQNLNIPMRAVFARMFANMSTITPAFLIGANAVDKFIDIAKKLTSDFLLLSSRGMGTAGNLIEISKSALLAGMSLKDYTEMIKENITFASRAGSLENFDKLTSAADKQLNQMGVFGSDAKALQASLANSATSMGVSQGQLTDTISKQISVFDQLRKSTNMTAQEFSALVKELANGADLQRELVGLAPSQRRARQQEFLQITTTGQRLGLAADASKALADALIKQRGETVKSRFEQAGRVRQMAAFAGMGSDGERAAQIIMKGRRASADELEELRRIAGSLDNASQSLYETGSYGAQNVVDQFTEMLGGKSFGDIMKANRPAELADTTKVNQEAFGKHVSEFGQWVGKLTAWANGLSESVVAPFAAAVGGVLLGVFRGPIIGLFQKAFNFGGGAVAGTGGALSNLLAPLSSFKNWISSVTPSMYSLGKAAGSTTQSLMQLPSQVVGAGRAFMTGVSGAGGPLQALQYVFKSFGSGILNGVKGLGSTLISGATGLAEGITSVAAGLKSWPLLGGIIAAAIELFTGDVTSALNPSGGAFERIGGAVVAFFSAIPNFIFDALELVFGPKMIDRIRGGFDMFVSMTTATIKTVFSRIFGDIASVLGRLLPDDSPIKKKFAEWSASASASADENFAAFDKLWNGEAKTLKQIGEQNQKAAVQTEKTAATATAKAAAAQSKFNNVQYGAEITRAQLLSDAKAIIGSPQVQSQTPIAQAQLNTVDASKPQNPAPGQPNAAPPVQQNTDVVQVLNAILAILQTTLTEEQKQTELFSLRSRGVTTFVSAETTANWLLKQGPST